MNLNIIPFKYLIFDFVEGFYVPVEPYMNEIRGKFGIEQASNYHKLLFIQELKFKKLKILKS